MRWISTLLITMAAIGSLAALAPADAHACSCAPTPIWRSFPEDGASGVPRNTAIVFDGYFDLEGVQLKDADGQDVPFDITRGPGLGSCSGYSGEVIAKQPLAANTTYTLTATGAEGSTEEPKSISFTTGDALATGDDLFAPHVDAAFVIGNPQGNSCLSTVQGCVNARGAESYVLVVKKGDVELTNAIVRGEELDRLIALTLSEEPDCIQLQERDVTGKRSEPSELCQPELVVREANVDDFDVNGEVTCAGNPAVDAGVSGGSDAGEPDEPDSGAVIDDESTDEEGDTPIDDGVKRGGCSVGARDSRSTGALVLMLLAALITRRRRAG